MATPTSRASTAIADIEKRLVRPAVTSNQAAMWYALRRCGIKEDIPALGRLFKHDLPQQAAAPQRQVQRLRYFSWLTPAVVGQDQAPP